MKLLAVLAIVLLMNMASTCLSDTKGLGQYHQGLSQLIQKRVCMLVVLEPRD